MSMIYADRSETRFFQVPEGAALPPGDLEITSLVGKTLCVDAGAAAAFQIPESVARALVEEKMTIIQGVVQRVATALVGAAPDQMPQRVLAVLSGIGISPAELPRDPGRMADLLGEKMMGLSLEQLKAL